MSPGIGNKLHNWFSVSFVSSVLVELLSSACALPFFAIS